MDLVLKTPLEGNLVLCRGPRPDGAVQRFPALYKFLWARRGGLKLEIDRIPVELSEGEIICLTPLHRIDHLDAAGEYLALLFDSNFYCIFGHDDEVSCNGLLFNGTSEAMRLRPDAAETAELLQVVGDLERDYGVDDAFREEMLRMHLKRFIILATRIARTRFRADPMRENALDIVRRYHVLVDQHFREKKRVQDYAELLHRSPKTLSNLFAACGYPSPLTVIRDRVNAEARRMLLYTSMTAKEIAYHLGFDDTAVFSRFFSQMNGESITAYRAREKRE